MFFDVLKTISMVRSLLNKPTHRRPVPFRPAPLCLALLRCRAPPHAERGRAGLGANRTVRPGNKVPCTLQGIEETSLQRLSRSTNEQNPR